MCPFLMRGQAPVADFSVSVSTGCSPVIVTFKDLSTGSPVSWNWDFHNGQLSTAQNPSISFSTGTYDITLTVKNANGINSITKTGIIVVNPSPSVNFTADRTIACVPATIQFTDLSVPNAGNIIDETWDFGDPPTGTGASPQHTYTSPGYYNITLKVTSSSGCASIGSKSRYIRITDGVNADFSYTGPTTCGAPYTVAYTNLTSGPGNLTYNWDLGNSTTSTQLSPAGTYNAAGNYTVQLISTSDFGCADTVQKTIPINTITPSFQTVGNKDSVCLGSPISFQNTSVPAPVSVTWDFGDGTSYSGPVPPAKTYASAGSYTVTMNAVFANCASAAAKTVTVYGKPAVDFSATNNIACTGPLAVAFQNLSPDVASSSWTFGEGGTSTSLNPTYTYGAGSNGTFDVSLTITDSKGCVNKITKPAFVQIQKPTVTITNLPGGVCVNKPYTATAFVNAVDGIASATWDFGDGTGPTTLTTHTYTTPGIYPLTLSIVTNGGCTASATAANAVKVGTPPVVDFSEDIANVCHSSSVTFTNLSTPVNVPPNPVLWSFGDGAVSPLQNPSHKFPDTGLYTIKLKVTNNGCADSLTKANFVHVLPPIANFGYTVPDCTVRNNVQFKDSSINDLAYGPLTYAWTFGDGTGVSTAGNPSYSYPTVNPYISYNVQLIATNSFCTDTIVKTIMLYNDSARFTMDKTIFCRNEQVGFNASGNYAYLKSFNWIVDGIPFITNQGVYIVTYNTTGNHTVQLVTTDVNGCPDTSAQKTFSVTGPTALFTIGNKGGCSNSTITFNDASFSSGTLTKWVFDFGDGITQSFTAPPFTHTYTNTGNYTVKLTVFDNTSNNCSDTYTLTGTAGAVITDPVPRFKAVATVFCPRTPLQFKDSSSGNGLTYAWDFGDGTFGTGKNPTHLYPAGDSTYSVKLVITDSVGCADSLTQANYIKITAPKPYFTAKDTVTLCPPLETTFTFAGKDYTSFSWDFGDGATSVRPSTSHFYNAYGKYIAKLYVTGFGGCVDSSSIIINVTDPFANTSLTFTPQTACNQLTVDFSVKTPPGTSFSLYFGDGTNSPFTSTSQDTSLTHFYGVPNNYGPYVFLKDNTGCQAQVGNRGAVIVKGAIPLFGKDKNKFCDSGIVYFTDYSQQGNDPIVTSTWNFGDGSTPVVLSGDVIHNYATTGLFVPSLMVTTVAGCSQTYTDTVRVLATPKPAITSIDAVCKNLSVDFAGSLLVPPDTAIAWLWTMNAGKTYSQQNITVNYPDTGLYHVSLQATNSVGCKGDTSKDILVYPLPVIKVTGDTSIISGSPGITIPITYSANAVTFNWVPSTSLSCTNCSNPFANPQFTTTYNVTVTDANGCISSRNLTLVVVCNNKNFFIPNTFSPNNDGSNDRFYPRGTGLNLIRAMRIFNRWGELVFEKRNFPANDALSGWDGTYKGKPAGTDTYIYMIDIICDNASIITYKGNVTLIR